jgi:hypothetical protein
MVVKIEYVVFLVVMLCSVIECQHFGGPVSSILRAEMHRPVKWYLITMLHV